MPVTFEQWTVLPHDPPQPVTDDILTVVGEIEMPLMTLPRRMIAVRLRDGRLVVYNAIALTAPEMERLERFGTPAFLVVANDHHRLDSKSWKARYPDIAVVAPPGARAAVERAVPVDSTSGEFGDPSVRFVVVPGTGEREAALEVRRPGGLTLVVNDVIANIQDARGFGGWLLRRMGFAGDEPHVPGPVRLAMVEDRAALAAQFRAWAADAALRRIVVAHGATIEDDPQGALLRLAEALD
jgi:hypothetical protein